jgi:integrase
LRFLAQILKQAERDRFLNRSPFDTGRYFQNESKDRRKPLILTWEAQERLLSVAPPRVRVLTVLGVETGMRTGEMLGLRWSDIDFAQNVLHVVKSKTAAGARAVPLTPLCKSELLRWRQLVGPEYSEWVFPSYENKRHRLQGGRKAWASALKKAGIPFRPIYYLGHTSSAELFNPANGTFSATGSMTTARTEHTSTLLGDGKVLVVGGVDANNNVIASAELYQ